MSPTRRKQLVYVIIGFCQFVIKTINNINILGYELKTQSKSLPRKHASDHPGKEEKVRLDSTHVRSTNLLT